MSRTQLAPQLSSGRFCPHPQHSSSENTTIRMMVDLEKETLSPPTASQQSPCLPFHPQVPILLSSLSQIRQQERNRPIPPQLAGSLSPPQILGPAQPKGIWGQEGER